jgi:ferrochelatase
MLKELGAKHGGELLMVPISFTSDHIETLYEMDVTYREVAARSGFTGYQRVLAANEDAELTECLVDILGAHGFPLASR